jgi:hypothetical protein
MPRRSLRRFLVAGIAAVLVVPGLGAAPATAGPECEEQSGTGVGSVDQLLGQGGEQCFRGEGSADVSASSTNAAVSTFTWSSNMTPRGYSARNVPTSGTGSSAYNSDLAFWGDLAFQGTYSGFRIIDISDPDAPSQIVNYEGCASSAGQGDVVVWENLLVRSWDAPAGTGLTCGGQPVPSGFEGVHLFNIANPAQPQLVGSVRMASNTSPAGCGSHTATLLPDAARGNIYLYVGGSSSTCTGIDIVRIPIANPAGAVYLRRAAAGRQCHDNNVILGDANLAVCAGGNGFSVFRFDPSINPSLPGGIENPTLLYSRTVTGVSVGHSATFTYDGEVLVFGHEPGGGSQAQCQSTSSVVNRSIYFFDPVTGTQLGSFVHPRPQTNTENCTWHNFNMVPTYTGYVFVSGNYQSGISVVDFTDPANAREIAFADPAPLNSSSLVLGGDWSTYWYDGHIYESDIRRGVLVWSLDDALVNRARTIGRSNPQTQEMTFDLDVDAPAIEITTPADGAVYPAGSELTADYACTDAGSGVTRCEGTVASGEPIDTSLGSHTFTVEAEDAAGHTSSRTVTYEVRYAFDGFRSPVQNEPTVNVAKAGSAVPVKFGLGGDQGLDIFEPGSPSSKPVSCTGGEQGAPIATSSAGGSGLHYDAAADEYVYVWKTDASWAGSCRQLVVTLRDGSSHTASFLFR